MIMEKDSEGNKLQKQDASDTIANVGCMEKDSEEEKPQNQPETIQTPPKENQSDIATTDSPERSSPLPSHEVVGKGLKRNHSDATSVEKEVLPSHEEEQNSEPASPYRAARIAYLEWARDPNRHIKLDIRHLCPALFPNHVKSEIPPSNKKTSEGSPDISQVSSATDSSPTSEYSADCSDVTSRMNKTPPSDDSSSTTNQEYSAHYSEVTSRLNNSPPSDDSSSSTN